MVLLSLLLAATAPGRAGDDLTSALDAYNASAHAPLPALDAAAGTPRT